MPSLKLRGAKFAHSIQHANSVDRRVCYLFRRALDFESKTFRGFNTAHLAPLITGEFYQRVFDGTEAELIYTPHIAEKLRETYPIRVTEAVDRGQLTLRTREKLPYGLAIFDERVGLGGYDDDTGLMQVFVDTDSPMAREWAERVYASIKADSTPLDSRMEQ